MLVLILLGTAGFGWHGSRIYRREAAIQTIERAGGEVTRLTREPAWFPAWLRGGMVKWVFHDVQFVGLVERDFSDADMAALSALLLVDTLYLDRTPITDAGLAHVADLSHLETLSLYETEITDSGVAHLKRLTKLRRLFLGRTQIGGSQLGVLQAMTKLQILDIRETRVTDAGVAELQQALPGLRIIR